MNAKRKNRGKPAQGAVQAALDRWADLQAEADAIAADTIRNLVETQPSIFTATGPNDTAAQLANAARELAAKRAELAHVQAQATAAGDLLTAFDQTLNPGE